MATSSRSSHFVGGGDRLSRGRHAGRSPAARFRSRLIVGTGKYKDFAQNAAAVEASGAEIVTVAVRRVNISDPEPADADRLHRSEDDHLPAQHRRLLHRRGGDPHAAAGARGGRLGPGQARGARRGARRSIPTCARRCARPRCWSSEGFQPMVYCVDDPIAAKQLEEAGAVAIMPLGAPIGSGLGIQNRVTIRLIVEGAKVPVLVDAGVGTASDAAVAMELGCDGVLMNTAIAEAKDPILMARAMKLAVESGPPGLSRRPHGPAPLRRSVQPARRADLGGGPAERAGTPVLPSGFFCQASGDVPRPSSAEKDRIMGEFTKGQDEGKFTNGREGREGRLRAARQGPAVTAGSDRRAEGPGPGAGQAGRADRRPAAVPEAANSASRATRISTRTASPRSTARA